MPVKKPEATATEIKHLKHGISKDGKEYSKLHAVGGVAGLLLNVSPSGAKSWIFRTKIGNKRKNIGLGGFPDTTLAQARNKAREIKEQINQGIDPLEAKKSARQAIITEQLSQMTFGAAAKTYLKKKSVEFKNPRQAEQWEHSLREYALPVLEKIPVNEINLPLIKLVLDPIWETKTETANRVRSRIENILSWSAAHGYRSEENPARWKGFLDKIYPSPSKIKIKKHHDALSVDQMPEFMKALQDRTGTAARALEFLILTASRTNEVIGDKRIKKAGITWQEVDFKQKVWTVPADRMKSGKLHRVPLTDKAIELLKSMEQGSPDALIFAGPKGDIPSNNFLSALLKRMDQPVTTHGFRSTFKDWARESTGYPDEVSELALAHVNSDATRAAYARSELLEKRRELMNDWEQYCYGEAK